VFNQSDLLPSLRDLMAASGLDAASLTVALPRDANEKPQLKDRHTIVLIDNKDRRCEWRVSSLRELFRGDKTPPSLEKYPPEYESVFYFIERHVLMVDSATGGRVRDLEMEEIYRTVRRRPDGRSLGLVHDFVWQVAATLLALKPLSQLEHEEVFGRLARSCSTFAIGATSRNYFTQVRGHLGS